MRTNFPVVFATLAFAACGTGPDPATAALFPDRGTFEVDHTLTVPVPAGSHRVRVWFPLPRLDSDQQVADLQVDAPDGWRETTDALGNRYVYADVASPAAEVSVRTHFRLTRSEQNAVVDPTRSRPLTAAEREQFAPWLGGSTHIVIDDTIRATAERIRGEQQNPVLVARAIYDWTLDNVEYWVKDPAKWKASPVGSSEYCMQSRTGNCTDFHSLYTALARASGIPTRMKYGSVFKPALDGVDRDASYHCWPESWFPGLGWVPNDVAVADIFAGPITLDADNTEKVTLTTATGYQGPDPALVDYYFGNLDPRRVTWSMGRDLLLEPRQSAGPVNANPKGYVEVDDAPFAGFQRKMSYRQID